MGNRRKNHEDTIRLYSLNRLHYYAEFTNCGDAIEESINCLFLKRNDFPPKIGK